MTQPLDWAPYSSDGEHFRTLAPSGMSYCLTTDDISGAKPCPSISRRCRRGQIGDKMLPELWLPKHRSLKLKPPRNLETCRVVNPLDPKYKLPSGKCLIPSGEKILFSKRVTDLMDTSDIPGTKPGSMCKRPLRSYVSSYYTEDDGFHPTKRTHIRKRITIGQGLDLFDIDIGKRQYGFKRAVASNPLEPVYPNDPEDMSNLKPSWMNRRDLPPHTEKKNSLERILDKIYMKAEMLPAVCRRFDPNNTNRISHVDFQKSLEHFGVHLSKEELNEVLSYAANEQTGNVRYNKFAKVLRSLDSWEKSFPKQLGADIGCPPSDANLGQGLQVLVDSKHKMRQTFKGEGHQHMGYNLLTGDPLRWNLPAFATREPLSFSYAEQAAALHSRKHLVGFAGLPPAEHRILKISPIMNMDKITKMRSISPLNVGRLAEQPSSLPETSEVHLTIENTAVLAQEQCAPAVPPSSSQMPPLYVKLRGNVSEGTIEKSEDMKKPKSPLATLRNRVLKVGHDVWQGPHLRPQHMGAARQEESVWKTIKIKKFLPQPFKDRICKEQHSADLQAVQILG